MSMYSNKRKLTDAEEEQILERIKAGDKYHAIAGDYNISMTTVSKIKKGRPSKEELDAMRESMSEQEPPSVKKLAEYYPQMNKRMLEWVAQAQKRNVRITSAMLQERAKIVADSIGWTSFRASSGWCVKFLRRNNIKLRYLKRKALLKSTCQEGTKWEEKILNPRLNPDGTVAEEDTSDSEGDLGEGSLDSDSEDDVLGKRSRPITLEKARKAWNQLQEWFISHPPHQDRVMQAVFIINKEMMSPSFAQGAAGSSSSAGVPLPLPINGSASPTSAQVAEILQGVEGAGARGKKRQASAAVPVNTVGSNFFLSGAPR